ncbi:uncharacterized protein PFL1_05955 [Pseudozyma flocculosa PF-1]|uniref:Uncharacterized protein n=1 Tax=Pseudozyma flocculosa PF-1 TaxID=1277687 RepID=A0A061H2Y5_9BASI|nr:uncharacterized protein PFL1_05955 [Pseudozyma flocculosa PF-1]EPQ26634.1 hypothetical protein PFL1_05955 [Pseudozyma flocculosa PF-1]
MKPIALFASLLLLTCLGIASVASLPDIDVLDKDVIEKIYRLHSLYTDGNTDPRVIEESLLRDIQSAGQWALTGFHVYDNNFSPRLGLPRDSFATLPEWLRFEHGQKYRPKIEEILRDRLQESQL